jgi:putative SOS response-associated peptidase YedK
MLDSFSVWRDANQIAEAWGEVEYLFPNLRGKFKKEEGQRVGVIINTPECKGCPPKLKYGHMKWGLKTDLKEIKGSFTMSEYHFSTGKKYQPFFKTRRCLVPVDRWFYTYVTMGKYIRKSFCPIEPEPMAFAGIYNYFDMPDGRKQGTVTVLGIAATEFYAECQENEMPAIFLPGPEAIQWLDPNLKEHKAWELVRAFPAEKMKIDGDEVS